MKLTSLFSSAILTLAVFVQTASAKADADQYWPQWRGPSQTGVAPAAAATSALFDFLGSLAFPRYAVVPREAGLEWALKSAPRSSRSFTASACP